MPAKNLGNWSKKVINCSNLTNFSKRLRWINRRPPVYRHIDFHDAIWQKKQLQSCSILFYSVSAKLKHASFIQLWFDELKTPLLIRRGLLDNYFILDKSKRFCFCNVKVRKLQFDKFFKNAQWIYEKASMINF